MRQDFRGARRGELFLDRADHARGDLFAQCVPQFAKGTRRRNHDEVVEFPAAELLIEPLCDLTREDMLGISMGIGRRRQRVTMMTGGIKAAARLVGIDIPRAEMRAYEIGVVRGLQTSRFIAEEPRSRAVRHEHAHLTLWNTCGHFSPIPMLLWRAP